MSSDGAHLGINAEDSMKAVLGGEQPKKRMSPIEMREYLMSQEGPGGYDGTAAYCAKLVLEAMLADPSLASIPADTKWDFNAPKVDGKYVVITKGLYETLKERGTPLDQLDLTGFMWGWAVNAARYCVELEPVPNPAIITIGG